MDIYEWIIKFFLSCNFITIIIVLIYENLKEWKRVAKK